MQKANPYRRQFSSALDSRLMDLLNKVSRDTEKSKAELLSESVRLLLNKYGEKVDF